jgi:solute carrier family 25 (adenine nucleotide translocator) protein 4/5/6/31
LNKQKINNPYRGIHDCFKRLYQEEGISAYFKGNLINVIRYFPTQALNFSFKDMYKRMLGKDSQKDGYWIAFAANIASGSAAGASTQFFVYPLDYTRTRLTNDIQLALAGQKRQYKGIIDCMRQTYETDGYRGLYRGFIVSCVYMMIYRGIYFGLNDSIKPLLPFSYHENLVLMFLIGYLITVTAGLCSYPLDTIRRRMMMSSG